MKIHNLIHKQSVQKVAIAQHLGKPLGELKSFALFDGGNCETCQWLDDQYINYQNNSDFERLYDLHKELHIEVNDIIRLAENGADINAIRAVGGHSKFTQITTEITRLLMRLDRNPIE